MGYAYPCDARYVPSDWADHRARTPCSQEPGTDYAAAYGSTVYAPDNGKVVDIKGTNTYGTGRFIAMDLDDGRRVRFLHLSTLGNVYVGMRVTKGQPVGTAKSGGSANGSDWGYGPHVHVSLWGYHGYTFGCNGPIDFEKYVGNTDPAGNQRVVGPNGANGRENPNTSGGVTQTLPPGTLADFNGWKNGESVEGNKVWFRGAHSGDWFWSGGFTDKGTHDLEDLNPATIKPNERQAGPNGVNGRSEPKTTVPVVSTLSPNQIGPFDGWINGETVEGNKVWFRGASSGNFYWSGGFTDKGTHDLEDLNDDPDPQPDTTRTVGVNDANIRQTPWLASTPTGSEDAGTVVPMDAWAQGQQVEGNDVWFRRVQGGWMWSGGFTSQATTGLTKVDAPDPPAPTDPDNPRGLPEETGFKWPRAAQALDAPLGHTDCKNPSTPYALRTTAGDDQHPVTPIIDTYIIHWTDTLVDQMDWFSYCNSRNVSPTLYMRRDGWQSQFIRPMAKPAATGPNWNWRSIAVETLAEPGSDFTDAQWEEHAQNIALLATYDGKELDGVPVSFKIDREHVKGHRECLPGTTDCPGDAQIAGLDALLARAQEIYDEGNPPVDPCADCPGGETIDYDKIAKVVNDEHARRMAG